MTKKVKDSSEESLYFRDLDRLEWWMKEGLLCLKLDPPWRVSQYGRDSWRGTHIKWTLHLPFYLIPINLCSYPDWRVAQA